MKLKFFILPLSCGLVLASCAKTAPEESGQQPVETSDGNVVSVIMADASDTKAAPGSAVSKTIIADLSEQTGIEGLALEESVSSLDDSFFAPETKGTPVYTENFADVNQNGFLAISVWDKTKSPIEKRDDLIGLFTKDEGKDTWSCDYGDKQLPESMLYYFGAPAINAPYISDWNLTPDTKGGSFTVTAANYPATAVAQQDLLFACSDVALGADNSVKFGHPFAAVKFKQKNNDETIQITKIEMTNILASGECVMTFVEGGKSADCCIWTPGTDRKTMSQTYSAVMTYENDGYFADSFYEANADNNLVIEGDTKATTTFNLVPQSFSENDANHVIVTITYTVGGVEKTSQVDFSKSLNGKKWEAGKLYTYSFNVTDLGVIVEDTCVADVVTEPTITNTGNVTGYIRVTWVSNWVMDDPEIEDMEKTPLVIISPCDIKEEDFNNIKPYPGPANNWICKDGYFYYKDPVPGKTSVKLFNSFQNYCAPAEYFWSSLNFHIIAQIVPENKVKEAWPDAPVGN